MSVSNNNDYIGIAQRNLGEAFDCAVNWLQIDIDTFTDCFIKSGAAAQFELKNPKYIVGMSGTELVMYIVRKMGLNVHLEDIDLWLDNVFNSSGRRYGYSKEYWSGWILAYYQWKSGKSFSRIFQVLSAKKILLMYHPLHEAPEDKFVEVANELMRFSDKL